MPQTESAFKFTFLCKFLAEPVRNHGLAAQPENEPSKPVTVWFLVSNTATVSILLSAALKTAHWATRLIANMSQLHPGSQAVNFRAFLREAAATGRTAACVDKPLHFSLQLLLNPNNPVPVRPPKLPAKTLQNSPGRSGEAQTGSNGGCERTLRTFSNEGFQGDGGESAVRK